MDVYMYVIVVEDYHEDTRYHYCTCSEIVVGYGYVVIKLEILVLKKVFVCVVNNNVEI